MSALAELPTIRPHTDIEDKGVVLDLIPEPPSLNGRE